ncbi:MAG: PKD domain-containing protein [Prolixibacteraceae bacterium]|nr:PKD domain-containing protein [Prolixibacteraceae bacterium]
MKFLIYLLPFLLLPIVIFPQNSNIIFYKTDSTKNKEVNITPDRSTSYINQNDFLTNYNLKGLNINTVINAEKKYQYVQIKGFGLLTQIGAPALPVRYDKILVNSKNPDLILLESDYVEYDGYMIHPALEPARDTEGATAPGFVLDSALYTTNKFYPEKVVQINRVSISRGNLIAYVQICPVQFNPVTRKIRAYTNIQYKMSSPHTKTEREEKGNSRHYQKLLPNRVLNPEFIEIKDQTESFKTESTSETGKNYIIITHSDYLDAAEWFAKWKRQLGYSVDVVSRTSWTAQQVKDSIQTRYTNWTIKPDYFLIIGDHDLIPGEIHKSPNNNDFATDYYYSDLEGDLEPEMAHGRISVSNPSEALNVIQKIYYYERFPINDSSFYANGLNCAQFQDYDEDSLGNVTNPRDGYAARRFCHSSEEIRDYLQNDQGYSVERIYWTDPANTPTNYNNGKYSTGGALPDELLRENGFDWDGDATDIISSINEGKFYVFHRDHGYFGGTGWAHPRFVSSDIPSLSNASKTPVVFSMNCHTGEFLLDNCFAETFLRHYDGGAVGVVAAAYYSYSGYNDAMSIGMVDAIWSNPGLNAVFGSGGISSPPASQSNNVRTMGDVVNLGLSRMTETWDGSSASTQYTYEIFHWFGDPAMRIWTENPHNNVISANIPDKIFHQATDFTITSCNRENALVTLISDEKMIAKSEVIEGSATLMFLVIGKENPQLTVTVSKENCLPLIKVIDVETKDNTYVPDNNFEQALIDLGYDSGALNDSVPTANIIGVTNLDVSGENISDLTGIEDFWDLEYLFCYNNLLTSIDVTQNKKLKFLFCQTNQLAILDVTQNLSLTRLDCTTNQLTNLNVRENTNLEYLYCAVNQLTRLDVNQNTALRWLYCEVNQITTLDISHNSILETLYCQSNQLTSIDVSNNPSLDIFYCWDNKLTFESLEPAIGFSDFRYSPQDNVGIQQDIVLNEGEDFIFNLEVGGNHNQYQWYKDYAILPEQTSDTLCLPNLKPSDTGMYYCAITNSVVTDLTLYCREINLTVNRTEKTYIPDDNFEQALIDLGYDSGALNDSVPTDNISGVTSLDVSSKNISDLTGIEDFSALKSLKCLGNSIANIDITQNTELTLFWCYHNQLSSLNISNNVLLTNLWCAHNQISNLNLNNNTALTNLNCSSNQLTSLDISKNIAIIYLSCGYNQISNLDISHNLDLKQLNCQNNQLSNLNIDNNTELEQLNCNDNQLSNLDVSKNIKLQSFSCYNNQINELDVQQNPALIYLYVGNNQLSNLNVNNNISLRHLDFHYNNLTNIDITQNTALTHLYCYNNELINLDTRHNGNLFILSCSYNHISNLYLHNNTKLTQLANDNNQIKNLDVTDNNALTDLWCYNNQLTFESLEPALSIQNFQYSPQDSVGTSLLITRSIGEDYLYTLHVGGNQNHFQWYKDYMLLPEQTSATLNLSLLTADDAGIYHCEVTNTLVTGLTLISRKIILNVVEETDIQADFEASPLSGACHLQVNFTDITAGTPTAWQWDFGDGNTSTLQNPSHKYANSGVYTITLTVNEGTNSDTEMKQDYITVQESVPVPIDTLISNTILNPGIQDCFNASNTILVAGDGTDVIFENGSGATLIAGHSIRFLHGFMAQPGSHVDAHITITNSFCNELQGQHIVENTQPGIYKNKIVENNKTIPENDIDAPLVKIYPNPSMGIVNIEWLNIETHVLITLYNSTGAKLIQESFSNDRFASFNLTKYRKGILFVNVQTNSSEHTQKIVLY